MNTAHTVKPRFRRVFRLNQMAQLKAAEKKGKEDLEEAIAAASLEASSEPGYLSEKSAEILRRTVAARSLFGEMAGEVMPFGSDDFHQLSESNG